MNDLITLQERGTRFSTFVKAQSDLIPEGRLSWDRGGCWTLAEAVRLWLGPQVTLWMLAGPKSEPHHVIAKIGEYFLDARGFQTEAKLLSTWAKNHPSEPLALLPFDTLRAQENDLDLGELAAQILSRRLLRLMSRKKVTLGLEAASLSL